MGSITSFNLIKMWFDIVPFRITHKVPMPSIIFQHAIVAATETTSLVQLSSKFLTVPE